MGEGDGGILVSALFIVLLFQLLLYSTASLFDSLSLSLSRFLYVCPSGSI